MFTVSSNLQQSVLDLVTVQTTHLFFNIFLLTYPTIIRVLHFYFRLDVQTLLTYLMFLSAILRSWYAILHHLVFTYTAFHFLLLLSLLLLSYLFQKHFFFFFIADHLQYFLSLSLFNLHIWSLFFHLLFKCLIQSPSLSPIPQFF